MAKQSDKDFLKKWAEFRDNTQKATSIDLSETPAEKKKRIKDLEANDEKWFKYYFPNYYTSEPAVFHIKATQRVLYRPEWFEIRAWSRELSKSGRTMMEVLKLTLMGKKKNIVLTSSSYDNAIRLLLPYKIILEVNNRIKNDYGEQKNYGNWTDSEFITKQGISFRAIGAGQSPRGTRNEAIRPDVLLIDDFDTDEECRNSDIINQKTKWLYEAFMATRSISNPLLVIVCGNIIAKYCCVTELAKKADILDIVNIRDKEGKSTWPQKNSEAMIDRVIKMMPWSSSQKEYFNNPIIEGTTFKNINYGKCPILSKCDQVIVYADPSTSNKDRGFSKQASYKCVVIIGSKGSKRYVYKVWLEQTSNSNFVDWLFKAYVYLNVNNVDTKNIYIENNSLQDPFYEQVILPLIRKKRDEFGFSLPITEDTRKKPEKFFRIEGTLEPLNRLGDLIFNEAEKKDLNMIRMHDQMMGVSEKAKIMDGPDAIEGACWIIQNRTVRSEMNYSFGAIPSRHY